LREFGNDEFAPLGHFDHHHPRTVAPVEFTRFELASWSRVGRGRGRRYLVAAAFTAQTAIRIACGLLGFVIALFDIGLGVVFLDPGQDVFGVE